ncbi:MAG: AAA family ATPase, partial [Acidimicrobiia bacterium]
MSRKGRPAIVGREAEIAALRRFVRDIAISPGALIISGEPGAGKTVLWDEAVDAARRRSLQVLSARPTPAETGDPFAALADLLADLLNDLGDAPLTGLEGAPRRALEVALLRVEPSGHALEPRAVATAVRHVLVQAAEAGPVLVAIDDVHWLDTASARALTFALRRLGSRPVGVLLAVRADHRLPVPLGLDRAFDGDRLTHLELGPLADRHLDLILSERLLAGLPPDVLVRVRDATHGNPFFALELGSAILARPGPLQPDEPLHVPPSLRLVLQERLDGLSPHAADAILTAAALPRPTRDLVHRAGTGPDGDADGLGELMRAGLVESDGERVTLVHPLLGALVYDEAPPDRRRRLHADLAGRASDPEERARHLALASRHPDEGVARALDEAAHRARARGAPEVAAGLADQALRCTPPNSPEARLRRSFEAADHHFAAGGLARAHHLLADIVAGAPRGVARARALHRLGELQAQTVGFPAADSLFTEALAEAGDDRPLRIELLCDLAFARLLAGDLGGAAEYADVALELAGGVGDEASTFPSLAPLVCVALCDFLRGYGVRSDLLERAMRIADRTVREAVVVRPGYLHLPHIPAAILKWADDLNGARARYALASHRTGERGDESWRPWLLYQMSELECWAGNWELAADLSRRAHESAERTGQAGVAGFVLYARALVAAHRGDVEDAQRLAEEGVAAAQAAGTLTAAILNQTVLGYIALVQGNHHGALAQLVPVRRTLAAIGLADPGVIRCLPDEIEAHLALGDLDQAEALLDGLNRQAAATGRASALAAGARGQGLL